MMTFDDVVIPATSDCMSTSAVDGSLTPVFEAVLTPHQSLGRRGGLILMGGLAFLSAGISLRFLLLGAWPVMAFSGVEIMLALVLLAIHRRRGRMRETIRLSEQEITVVQTAAGGARRSFSLPSAWVQVRLESIGGRQSRLMLRSHGRDGEVGAFLHEPERRSLFEALQGALHRLRQPQFQVQRFQEE